MNAPGGGGRERSRLLVGVVVVALTLGAIAAVTLGESRGERSAEPPVVGPPTTTAPKPPHLVALGDSVAAGYAAGGRAAAYPTAVGAAIGLPVDNLATAGATASTVLREQLPAIPRLRGRPAVVTVTVGANDIRFAECFGALFGIGTDPCAGDDYQRSLDALATNLSRVLDRVHASYPQARVFVSRYYDPLPRTATELCGIDDARFSGGGIGDRTARRLARRLLDQRLTDWQQRLYTRATRRLSRLNAVLDGVAVDHQANIVGVDFTGHDVCATNPWVFPPDITARLNFRWAGPDYAETLTYTGAQRCVAPCGSALPFTARFPATVGTLVVTGTLRPNGTPHPDAAGQHALAAAFLHAIRR
jgi:lysophospholipase L1-like esterase